MLKHPCFDPVALHLGPLAIRWYGLMYLLAFVFFILLARYRVRQYPERGWNAVAVDDLLFYGVLGVILGGRLGYVLFYKLDYYLQHPLEILAIWQGGMSFHGGFLGVIFAMWLYAKRRGKHWFAVTDFIAPMVPLGYAFGRIGNFINAELPGRRTDLPWGMLFPRYYDENAGECVWPGLGEASARHPSQLYQAALDGLVLFIILWVYSRKSRPLGAVSALFLIGYGVFRFLVEFTREPDDFLGLLALNLTMGQWLSLPMIVGGIVMMVWAYRQPVSAAK